MEQKGTSKVATVSSVGEWKSDHGVLYYKFLYEFEDGTKLTARHKKNSPKVNTGDEAEYEIIQTTQYGNMGRVSKVGGYNPSGGRAYKGRQQSWPESMSITRDACFGAACDYYAKLGGADVKTITALADRFVKFVIHGTPEKDFEMWGAEHKNLIHRNSVIKNVVKVADSEDDCLRYAMESIKYINQ